MCAFSVLKYNNYIRKMRSAMREKTRNNLYRALEAQQNIYSWKEKLQMCSRKSEY